MDLNFLCCGYLVLVLSSISCLQPTPLNNLSLPSDETSHPPEFTPPAPPAVIPEDIPRYIPKDPLSAPVDNVWREGYRWILQDSYLNSIKVPHAAFATIGHVTPRPVHWSTSEKYFSLRTDDLHFVIIGPTNNVLESAIKRYRDLIANCKGISGLRYGVDRTGFPNEKPRETQKTSDNLDFLLDPWPPKSRIKKLFAPFQHPSSSQRCPSTRSPYLNCVKIHLRSNSSSWPSSSMIEIYSLFIDSPAINIFAYEVWGALRGLETLSQLIWCTPNGNSAYVNNTYIRDYPRFSHRGILIDTSRHYISKAILLKNLEAMECNKMNVFHWHILDDQSFPLQITKYPELSGMGAFRSDLVYSKEDVREIVNFARDRGIRVIPEIDLPGHTRSWAYSHPEMLTRCFENGEWTDYFGPLDPTKNETYSILRGFFSEIVEMFPDKHIHLGFDEFQLGCWESSPQIRRFMKENHFESSMELLTYFHRRLLKLIAVVAKSQGGRNVIFWQDAFDYGLQFSTDSTIQLWKDRSPAAAKAGLNVLFSTCWYLDHVKEHSDWIDFYLCDPSHLIEVHQYDVETSNRQFIEPVRGQPWHQEIKDTDRQFIDNPIIHPWLKNIKGGEACMWAEYESDDTILQKIWPITSTVAERLWSPRSHRDVDMFAPRLEEQRCRLSRRGIPVSVITGPNSCSAPVFAKDSIPLIYDLPSLSKVKNMPLLVGFLLLLLASLLGVYFFRSRLRRLILVTCRPNSFLKPLNIFCVVFAFFILIFIYNSFLNL